MTKRELKEELKKRDNQLKQLMFMVEELTKKVDALAQKSSVENHYHYHTQMPYYVPPLIPYSQPQPPLITPQPIVTTWYATQTNNNNTGEGNCLLPKQGLKCNGDSISGLTAVSVSPASFTH